MLPAELEKRRWDTDTSNKTATLRHFEKLENLYWSIFCQLELPSLVMLEKRFTESSHTSFCENR